jgi:hypothetical protein
VNAGVTVAVGNAAAALALVVLGVGLGEKAGAAAESDICERRDRRRSKRKKRTDRLVTTQAECTCDVSPHSAACFFHFDDDAAESRRFDADLRSEEITYKKFNLPRV